MDSRIRTINPLVAHLLCGIFFGVGLLLFWQSVHILVNVNRAKQWVEVPAKAIASTLVQIEPAARSRTTAPQRRVQGVYLYNWEGREYRNTTIEFGGSFNNFSQKRQSAQYTKLNSEAFSVYVNPVDPNESVLDRTFPGPLMAFNAAFLLFPCFLGVVWFWRGTVTILFKGKDVLIERVASTATMATFLTLPVLSMALHYNALSAGTWAVFLGVCLVIVGIRWLNTLTSSPP